MSFASKAVTERLRNNGCFLVTNIDFEVLRSLASWIIENCSAKKAFTIAIDSSGGSPGATIDFASFLGTLDKEVKLTGVVFGECGSSALALLQCCHERIALSHCGFFIHHVRLKLDISVQKATVARLKEEIECSREIEKDIVRLQCKRTGISEAKWKRLADRGDRISGRPIFPKEALKLGLVDKIVDRFPIF